jgi:hypothetical protein
MTEFNPFQKMSYGICHLSLVPCRKEPSDRSELVTELLFGESFMVLETSEKWSRISAAHDDYESWIDNKQFLPLSATAFQDMNSRAKFYSSELAHVIVSENGQAIPLLLGSTLPAFIQGVCHIENRAWKYEGQYVSSEEKARRPALIETALMYLHAPYRWGGRSPFGIDCSGFSQIVYALNGTSLKRDAWQQAEQGSLLSFVEEAEPGDLAFFDNDEGRIVHVGIILQGSRIIHASGQVRIDAFDHHGIYNAENKKYSHNLRMIRRVL